MFQDSDVRLFDKGEMNTYRDDIMFAFIVSQHLAMFVNKVICLGRVLTNAPRGRRNDSCSSPLQVDPETHITRVLHHLVDQLMSSLRSASPAAPTWPLVNQAQYQTSLTQHCRQLLTIKTITTAITKPPSIYQDILDNVLREITNTYLSNGTLANSLLSKTINFNPCFQ